MTKRRVFIKVIGIVQGVGFRPFVYNLAHSCRLMGWVNNNSEGVYIDLEGEHESIEIFLSELNNNPPPLSRIENILLEEKALINYTDFTIKESERKNESITLISPDIALCDDCKADILDPTNRRYGYPFTNCTNCGPRFSIIKSIPYDRDKTTMKKFKMCTLCEEEYTNPLNRRFHAQPNACKDCGPQIWIADNKGNSVNIEYKEKISENLNTIKWTVEELKKGKIFAIKGLTGFHLCCNALDETAVNLLRQRKKRPHKPFAVMAKDLNTIKRHCNVNNIEEELLSGIRKPIVLLNQKKNYNLPSSIAPNQKTLGVMLPYTPLHQLLFNEDIDMLIMTSANYFSLPLEYDNDLAVKHLSSIVDYFLMHNRDIHIPVDDSVVKVIDNEVRIIRRARGYAPDPIRYNDIEEILALGPNMKNTFSIGKDNFIFLSQHNGDLENLETIEHYERNIEHFKNIFSFKPKYIAYDLHPEYTSTKYAENYDTAKIGIQHHHAHIASCMVENNIKQKVIGVSFDGTGYGTDGNIWGGEFLLCDLKDFKRLGHLDYIRMPGGEKAIKEPFRMALSYIYESLNKSSNTSSFLISNLDTIAKKLFGDESLILLKLLGNSINSPYTSSMGRFFDAVSSIIGINHKTTYEGQASIELENIIEADITESYPYDIRKAEEGYIIEPYETICNILEDRFSKIPKSIIAAKFHNTVIEFTNELCSIIRLETGINEVALSGGVFQNSYLLENLVYKLKANKFVVYTHKLIPTNDGGISLGQIAIANEKVNEII